MTRVSKRQRAEARAADSRRRDAVNRGLAAKLITLPLGQRQILDDFRFSSLGLAERDDLIPHRPAKGSSMREITF